jgi:hypothetical protein
VNQKPLDQEAEATAAASDADNPSGFSKEEDTDDDRTNSRYQDEWCYYG